MVRLLLLLLLVETAAAQSIVVSGGGRSIAVSGSAAVPQKTVTEATVEPFKEVPSPAPKFVDSPAAKPSPPAPVVVTSPVRRVTQRFLVVTASCPACPAAKAAFEAAGNPRQNIISPGEAFRRFGVNVSRVPYEFTAQVDVNTSTSQSVQYVPAQRQRLPIVDTQWGRIDLETYQRNCNCSMCQSIRAMQSQYRTMSIEKGQETPTKEMAQAPTPDDVIDAMLELLRLTPDDRLADLGCGDGRILIAAARQYGCSGVGVEIDPDKAVEAKVRVNEAGLDDRITIITGDALAFDPVEHGVTALTAYLYPDLLARLAGTFRKVRTGASPYHLVPGLPMTRHGNVWLYRQ